MKNYKNTVFYVILVGGLLAIMYGVITLGTQLQDAEAIANTATSVSAWQDFLD